MLLCTYTLKWVKLSSEAIEELSLSYVPKELAADRAGAPANGGLRNGWQRPIPSDARRLPWADPSMRDQGCPRRQFEGQNPQIRGARAPLAGLQGHRAARPFSCGCNTLAGGYASPGSYLTGTARSRSIRKGGAPPTAICNKTIRRIKAKSTLRTESPPPTLKGICALTGLRRNPEKHTLSRGDVNAPTTLFR